MAAVSPTRMLAANAWPVISLDRDFIKLAARREWASHFLPEQIVNIQNANNEHNEHCWVILGRGIGSFWFGRLAYLSEGEPNKVAFDAEQIFAREDRRRDVIGFVHTHPNTDAHPSSTDRVTMQGWVMAMGKPLVCGISGNDGLKSFVYSNDESDAVEGRIFRLGNFVCGTRQLG